MLSVNFRKLFLSKYQASKNKLVKLQYIETENSQFILTEYSQMTMSYIFGININYSINRICTVVKYCKTKFPLMIALKERFVEIFLISAESKRSRGCYFE